MFGCSLAFVIRRQLVHHPPICSQHLVDLLNLQWSLPVLTCFKENNGNHVLRFVNKNIKPMNTDWYLEYSAHHPEHVKRGTASYLFHRARTVTVGENIQKEEHLGMVLRTNGYPVHVIQAAARPRKKRTTLEEQPKYTICLPYVAGVGEDLRRVCRKFDIRTVFTTMSMLRQQLTKVKDTDPTLKKSSVVYRPSSHWTRKDREIGHCRACLGETTSPPMGQHHYT